MDLQQNQNQDLAIQKFLIVMNFVFDILKACCRKTQKA